MTKCKQIAFLAGCAAGPFGATLAQAQGPAKPQALEGAYRGMFVCEKMAASPDILHVPSDLVVNGDTVAFARPIFNWNGRRVLGSELGIGTVGADGKLGLKSSWNFRGVNYTGKLQRHVERQRRRLERHAKLAAAARRQRQPHVHYRVGAGAEGR
jgi:hypothetical protein